MNPLIKWPGGKSGEINKIEKYIPSYNRYVEPFFGGGALFFHLHPQKAAINDISQSLIDFYRLIKNQDKVLYDLLLCYNNSFSNLIKVCKDNYSDIFNLYNLLSNTKIDKGELKKQLSIMLSSLADKINSGFSEKLLLNNEDFTKKICEMVVDKMQRTIKNNAAKPFSEEDLKNNLITGFTSGYYMYFRDVYNDINLERIQSPSLQYKIANFCFIREYCYGSMFRYNKKGEFNIPYGGLSYNKKNFKSKIDNMFNKDVQNIFMNTDINCTDFENFVEKSNLTDKDFMFLDPPYDTDFSDYEGKDFTKMDQERLAHSLSKTMAQFILVIKNTDFIYSLYKDKFNIVSFDNQYTCNVRSRNDRNVEHLLITNLPV
jgi:DNA adenine methylase